MDIISDLMVVNLYAATESSTEVSSPAEADTVHVSPQGTCRWILLVIS